MDNSLREKDVTTHLHPQTNFRRHEEVGPLIIEGGDGVRVTDSAGRAYIEGVSGLWCAALGFSNKRLADAAHAQLCRLPYQQTFAHRSNPAVIELAEALVERAPGELARAMFQCSGSEAVDTAIKTSWYYHAARGKPEKRKVISRQGSYHGTTIASASLTGLPNMHRGFGIPLEGFIHVSRPHFWRGAQEGETERAFSERLIAEIEAVIEREGADTIGAFFAEPVMGTGGVVLPPEGYFELLQPLLKKHDILFVVDEVICGFGRTGHYWGSDFAGLSPDMMTCAKGLSASYFPISALTITDEIYQVLADRSAEFGAFGHGFTYGGHPVGAAVALETLRIYDEIDIVAKARARQDQLQQGLRALADHPNVGEVRGVGMMAAIEFVQNRQTKAPFANPGKFGARVSEDLARQGILLRALGDTLVFAPPLIISEGELSEILDAVHVTLGRTEDIEAA
ncbi:MAG: aminotransferase class III-fold pyridoxal phosphate-dependent enzyme [Nitratireductor sp.]|nr:aminotransferase class III-fold pyridoxal phosphate-dependent enzyme [Nitratireductor sp.]